MRHASTLISALVIGLLGWSAASAAAATPVAEAHCPAAAPESQFAASDLFANPNREMLAMRQLHEADAPVPAVGAEIAPGPHAITARLVNYHQVDGREVVGYLAEPIGGAKPAPGVLLIHEWWGLNANIEAMTRQLATEGYAAFAVDLYQGVRAETPEQAAAAVQKALANQEEVLSNLRRGLAVLRRMQKAPKVGVLGWCFGGAMAMSAASDQGTAVDATVVYYGRLPTDTSSIAAITSPVLGIFGANDASFPLAGIDAFDAAMAAQKNPAQMHVFAGAGHAFANPSGKNYQAVTAAKAWQLTRKFLQENLY